MFTKNICHKRFLEFIYIFLNPERGEFVPKLAALFTPSIGKKEEPLSAESVTTDRVHSITEGEWVGCGLELGLSVFTCCPWVSLPFSICVLSL